MYVSAGPLSIINIWGFTNLLRSMSRKAHCEHQESEVSFSSSLTSDGFGKCKVFLTGFFVLLFLIRKSRVIESGTFHCQMTVSRQIILKAPFKCPPHAIFSIDQLLFLQGKIVVEQKQWQQVGK